MRHGVLPSLFLTAVAAAAGAQTAGGEFLVHAPADGYRGEASVSMDDSGRFVVAWVDLSGDNAVAWLRPFAADGSALGDETRVSDGLRQVNPVVSAAPRGGFVALWASGGIRGRWFAADGTPNGNQFVVDVDENSRWPVAAAGLGRGLIAAWNRSPSNEDNIDLLARRFDRAGAALARSTRVDVGGRFDYLTTALCASPSGGVVAWTEAAEPPFRDANPVGRLLGRLGKPAGEPFSLAAHVEGYQELVGMSCGPDGSFTAFWQGDTSDGEPRGLAARRFDAAGAPASDELLLNGGLDEPRAIWTARAAVGPSGEFLVAWATPGVPSTPNAVRGQWFDATGAPHGDAFPISESEGLFHEQVRVASSASGQFVVVWTAQDGATWDLLGRRLETPFPILLSISDAAVVEGHRGTRQVRFTVSLSEPRPVAVRARFRTFEGTARAGADYSSASGIVRIPPGQTSGVVTVTILGDRSSEDDETFGVRLSDPWNVTLADAEAVGTITDDDGLTARSDPRLDQ